MPTATTLAIIWKHGAGLAERTPSRQKNSPTLGSVRELHGMLECQGPKEGLSQQCRHPFLQKTSSIRYRLREPLLSMPWCNHMPLTST